MASCKKELSDQELINEFNRIEDLTGILRRLSLLKALNKNEFFQKKDVILQFYTEGHVRAYQCKSRRAATKELFKIENENPELDVVLVRAETQSSIRDAFRNYFSDAQDFVKIIKQGISQLEVKVKDSSTTPQ